MFAAKNLLLTSAKVFAPVVFKGANSSNTGTVTIPSHNVGDIIVIYAYNGVGTTAPAKPTASGTVPNWVQIDAPTGANSNASGTWYFVATATNHTSGSWSGANDMIAVVLSGQGATQPGGHAESGGTTTASAIAPAVTMATTDGTSALLHFFGITQGATTWSAAPAGYTQQSATVSTVCCDTKNSTTTDGSVTQTFSTSISSGYRGATVEIRAH